MKKNKSECASDDGGGSMGAGKSPILLLGKIMAPGTRFWWLVVFCLRGKSSRRHLNRLSLGLLHFFSIFLSTIRGRRGGYSRNCWLRPRRTRRFLFFRETGRAKPHHEHAMLPSAILSSSSLGANDTCKMTNIDFF